MAHWKEGNASMVTMRLANFSDHLYHCPFCGIREPGPDEVGGCAHYAYSVGFGELLGAGPQLIKRMSVVDGLAPVKHDTLLAIFEGSENFVEFEIQTASDVAYVAFNFE